jgi:tetratricopeptide (TPR) repeat protein
MSHKAQRAHKVRDLSEFDRIAHQIAAFSEGQGSRKANRALAIAYNYLGILAQDHGQYDKAKGWYKKAIAIYQMLGDPANAIRLQHQLGILAYSCGNLDEAEGWFKKSLAISEESNDQRAMAATYYQLGKAAHDRGRLDEAEGWHRKSLTIEEALGDQGGMVSSYQELGTLAMHRGHLDEAEAWYKKSLAIELALGNQSNGVNYHQLGNVALRRGRLDEAEGWYTKSLTIAETLGDQLGMAKALGNLSTIRAQQNDHAAALALAIRASAPFKDISNPPLPALAPLALLWQKLGVAVVAEAWQKETKQSLPQNVAEILSRIAAQLHKHFQKDKP